MTNAEFVSMLRQSADILNREGKLMIERTYRQAADRLESAERELAGAHNRLRLGEPWTLESADHSAVVKCKAPCVIGHPFGGWR